jgi:pathogenesis-related protein 1
MDSQNNNLLVAIIMSVALVAAAILTVPSSVLQVSHAQTSADFQNTILSIHNQERALVKVPALTWNDNLAAAAKTWATYLTTLGLRCDPPPGTCNPPPHDNSIRGIQSENLWAGTAGRYTTAQQVQSWVNEKSNYIPGTPIKQWQEGDPVTGHYTQMVWQTTKEIGCATASDGNMEFLVCRYSPSGNYLGQTPYPYP